MSLKDIQVTIEDYVHAARCAIEAGFDVVEIVLLLLVPYVLLKNHLLTERHGRRQETVISVTNS